jgi:hypothetical protein
MIYWQIGKPQIWDDMIAERTKLIKMRHAEERAVEEAKQKHKEKMAELGMLAMYFLGGGMVLFALLVGGIGVYGSMEEKRVYEEKMTARLVVIQRQAKERADRERKEQEQYAKGAN